MFPELSLITSHSILSHSPQSPDAGKRLDFLSQGPALAPASLRSDSESSAGCRSEVFIVTQFILVLLISGDIDNITQLNMHGLSCVSITEHVYLISDDQILTRFPPAKYSLTISRLGSHDGPDTRHGARVLRVRC